MKKLALHWKIIIGLLLGVLWAFIATSFAWQGFTQDWLAPFGKIFINLLKMIAIPLVLFSVIDGVSNLTNIQTLGKVGFRTITAYLITTVTAVSIGILLVNTIQPGKKLDESQRISNRISYEIWAEENNIEIKDGISYLNDARYTSHISKANTQYQENKVASSELVNSKQKNVNSQKESGPLKFIEDMVPSNVFVALSSNKLMLQIIFFALFFGVALILTPNEKRATVKSFVDGVNAVLLKMVDIVMLGAPFFVFALMGAKLTEMAGGSIEHIKGIMINLGWYSLVVILGLGFMAFGFYPTVVRIFNKKIKYSSFFKKIGPAQLLAFSSSSSAATLPVTMECVEKNLEVPEEVTSFVLPIGATINMDGTSLYQAVAVIYLAQIHNIDLSMMQQLTVIATATLASIGSAAVPSAGLVMLMIVLDSVGLNPAWIAIIFPIDRLLDMCRTVVNVTGDASVATIIAKMVEKK